MNATRLIAFTGLLCTIFLLAGLIAPSVEAGVLRYADPWSRPNDYDYSPNRQSRPGYGEEENKNQEQAPPSIETPGSDRSPMRFDTYEDKWYDRM